MKKNPYLKTEKKIDDPFGTGLMKTTHVIYADKKEGLKQKILNDPAEREKYNQKLFKIFTPWNKTNDKQKIKNIGKLIKKLKKSEIEGIQKPIEIYEEIKRILIKKGNMSIKNPYAGTEQGFFKGLPATKVIYTHKEKKFTKSQKARESQKDKIFQQIEEAANDILTNIKQGSYSFYDFQKDPASFVDMKLLKNKIFLKPVLNRVFQQYRGNYDESKYFKDLENFFDSKGRIKNPSQLSKAKKLFEGFNHYPVEKIIKINIPINSKTVFSKLGFIENLEYISDKAIYKTDKKTRKRKIRSYIHNFPEHGKRPYLFSNEDGSVLIIYDPTKKIEVKPEGII